MTVSVTLTLPELMFAASVGCLRRVQNIKTGLAERPRYGIGNADAWTADIEGAAGEAAVAKWLGAYWCGSLGNLKASDVGRYQVRTTVHPNGCLLLHPKDSDDDVFIMARGSAPSFELAGWILGRDGKHADHWRDKAGNWRPAYFVPASRLRQMRELPRLREDRAA